MRLAIATPSHLAPTLLDHGRHRASCLTCSRAIRGNIVRIGYRMVCACVREYNLLTFSELIIETIQ